MTPDRLRRAAIRRRLLFFTLTFVTAFLATGLMYDILSANGFTALEKVGLGLFFILITWITGAFWTAVLGFCIQLRGRDKAVIRAADVEGRTLTSRTAVIMPIYNEDTKRVIAGLDVIWTSLQAQPQQAAFDLFILSDTRKPEIAAAEEVAFRDLVKRHHGQGRMFYRRREQNTGKKAGNVADFVRSWGGAYDYAIVLDADSIMTGGAFVSMAALMDAHPEAGIIQALPCPAGRETLFARLIQFAARLNSLMLASGLAYWQLGEGNYWGHNAILRLRQFAEFCDLPKLPGAPPLGGEILSHDFVEAAFMRRAGYQVWLVADIEGSWEEVPSNVIDYAARDRRWAQGNLQHLGLLPMRGLHWLSRIHLVTGVLSYATSPIWFTVLMISSVIVCTDAIQGFQYFEPGAYTLFPQWPESRATEIVALLSGTLFILLMPKVLGMLLALVKPSLRHAFGGGPKLFMSVLIEQVFSTLLAPSMMIFHTTFVITTLAGHPVQWNSQERGDRGIGFGEAVGRHKWQILLGIAWAAVILAIAPRYIWWMTPIVAGLVLSAPLTMLTSRASVGRWMRARGLLMTPEEVDTPRELAALEERLAEDINLTPAVSDPGSSTPGPAVPPGAVPEPTPGMASNMAPLAEPTPLAARADVLEVVPDRSGTAAQSIAARRADDILGIQLQPAHMPLQMEAKEPVYLRPRDALSGLHRLLGGASTTLP
jgi:membrane glycosyltransferase